MENNFIVVECLIDAPVEKVWEFWTEPKHIIKWNNASKDWCTPWAENDLRTGGKFLSRMEAKDGSAGFDFKGVYSLVNKYKKIEYAMEDERKVGIKFLKEGNKVKIIESFQAEETNSHEMQKEGWQSILNNFKKYVESN